MRLRIMEYITAQKTAKKANITPQTEPKSKFLFPANSTIATPVLDMSMPMILFGRIFSCISHTANNGANNGPVDNIASAIVGDDISLIAYISKMKYRNGCSMPAIANMGKSLYFNLLSANGEAGAKRRANVPSKNIKIIASTKRAVTRVRGVKNFSASLAKITEPAQII